MSRFFDRGKVPVRVHWHMMPAGLQVNQASSCGLSSWSCLTARARGASSQLKNRLRQRIASQAKLPNAAEEVGNLPWQRAELIAAEPQRGEQDPAMAASSKSGGRDTAPRRHRDRR
jgi:hypothetical protein